MWTIEGAMNAGVGALYVWSHPWTNAAMRYD